MDTGIPAGEALNTPSAQPASGGKSSAGRQHTTRQTRCTPVAGQPRRPDTRPEHQTGARSHERRRQSQCRASLSTVRLCLSVCLFGSCSVPARLSVYYPSVGLSAISLSSSSLVFLGPFSPSVSAYNSPSAKPRLPLFPATETRPPLSDPSLPPPHQPEVYPSNGRALQSVLTDTTRYTP